MKRFPPIQGWLLVALLYTAASLVFFGGRLNRSALVSARPAFTLPADPARQLQTTVRADAPRQAVLSIPFKVAAMERTRQYRCVLLPREDLPKCLVQVIAEGDHHFSFSHVYRCAELPRAGFAFTVPMRGEAGYWRTVGHRAPWTAWERTGLRRLEVKVFFAASAAGKALELRYRDDPEPAADTRLSWSRSLADSIPLGGRFELAFDLEGWNGNPFSYKELPVALEVTAPDGKPQQIRPFLTQDFEAVNQVAREQIRPAGPKHFCVRYRPVRSGAHAYRLLALESGGGSRVLSAGRFEVTAGQPPAFLRVSTRAPHFFERADGRFVYLIGWNFPYPVDHPYGVDYVPYLPSENSLALTRKMLDDLADSGGNFIRFWLSDWWNGLEWNKDVDNYSGIGRYNLKNAWLNDRVLERCEQRGIYMQLETLNHVRLSEGYGWPKHPYSVRNGGFLRRPQEFFVNPETRKWSENRLSYLVARYADSPAIQSWNLMSEPDQVANYVWSDAKELIVSQLEFIRRIDPYKHITCNHVCLPDWDIDFFRKDVIEFVNCNAYEGLGGLAKDQIPAVRDFANRYNGHGRPMIIAEAAGHWGGDPAFKMRRDTIGMLWAGIASDLAGSPLSWWWNFNYGEDLGTFYRVAADFMKDEDLIAADAAAGGGGWSNRVVQATNVVGNLRAMMVGNRTRRFLFAYNFDTLCRTRQIPSPCGENSVRFGDMQPGDYRVEYWDLHNGKTALRQDLRVDVDGSAVLHLPEFTEGWAVKIMPRGDAAAPDRTGPAPTAQPLPQAPAAARAPLAAGTRTVTASDWSWRIQPLVESGPPAVRERSLMEVRLAVPEVCRGRYPRLVNASGAEVPFAWQSLEDGAGWQIRVPAVSVTGPMQVTAVAEKPANALALDEEVFGLGLTVAFGRTPWMTEREQFDQSFARLSTRKQTRVSCIDQTENPFGNNSWFLALYQGPLLAPADGVYTFASNSDDASFASVDGQEVVNWGGGHDMEVRTSPMGNLWLHRGEITLKQGMHWVSYAHQQKTGGCLARLGWLMPATAVGTNAVLPQPFSEGCLPGMEVVPEWALDGRIPCRVEVQYQGRTLAVLDPCCGLELRRPRLRLAAVALEGPGGRAFRFFQQEGLHRLDIRGQAVPVWVWNAYWRQFSLEWESCVDPQRQPAVKVMLYDIDMPLSIQFDNRPALEKTFPRRTWQAWPQPVTEPRPAAFTISAGQIPLVHGTLGDRPGSRAGLRGESP